MTVSRIRTTPWPSVCSLLPARSLLPPPRWCSPSRARCRVSPQSARARIVLRTCANVAELAKPARMIPHTCAINESSTCTPRRVRTAIQSAECGPAVNPAVSCGQRSARLCLGRCAYLPSVTCYRQSINPSSSSSSVLEVHGCCKMLQNSLELSSPWCARPLLSLGCALDAPVMDIVS